MQHTSDERALCLHGPRTMGPSSRGLLVRMLAIALAAISRVPLSSANQIQQASFLFSSRTVKTARVRRCFHVQPLSASTRLYRAFTNPLSRDGGTPRRRPRYARKCAVASGAVLAAQAADSSHVAEETVSGGPSAGVWSASPTDPTFRELYTNRLPEWLLARLEELGFASPTLVQREALEVIRG